MHLHNRCMTQTDNGTIIQSTNTIHIISQQTRDIWILFRTDFVTFAVVALEVDDVTELQHRLIV